MGPKKWTKKVYTNYCILNSKKLAGITNTLSIYWHRKPPPQMDIIHRLICVSYQKLNIHHYLATFRKKKQLRAFSWWRTLFINSFFKFTKDYHDLLKLKRYFFPKNPKNILFWIMIKIRKKKQRVSPCFLQHKFRNLILSCKIELLNNSEKTWCSG